MNNSLIKSAAPAASGNNELMWHLCLLRHYRSWEYIKPLTENALWWPLFPSLSTSTETRRLIMIIYLLITFTYISRRTVGETVCRLEELIEVFFISASRIQTQNAKLGCQVFCATAGKQTDTMMRWGGRGQEHTAAIGTSTSVPPPPPPSPKAWVKDQISTLQPLVPKYPGVRSHNLIRIGRPLGAAAIKVRPHASPLHAGVSAQLCRVQPGN